jgi:4-nitrophenyl phosphatase
LKNYKAYLFDLDGTIYRGKEPIPEAVDFVKRLKAVGTPYLFVTNNAARTKEEMASTLQSMGVPTNPENVITSSMATAAYIKEKSPNASVFIIGEDGLLNAIRDAGLSIDSENPDYVVVGLDRELTYEKLALGSIAIQKGATFLSTNPDVAIPTERGLLPGNGAITSVLKVATGVSPIYIGKPEPIIIRQALDMLKLEPAEALMVGDNYNTDILAGMHAGVDTLLVHTGVTRMEDLELVEEQPTYFVESLKNWSL